MKLTNYIIEYLKHKGIDTIFGYTGGSIADLIDSIFRIEGVQFIQNYNEQASSFCANSYAQITGKTGVAISSSGPGAINMINGIANAYYDSIPCMFITGNVHSLSKNTSKLIRQNAFQETDIVAMVKDITKYAIYLDNENNIKYELEKAFYIANEGRKGPVLIDIPYDIQRKIINVKNLKSFNYSNFQNSENKTKEFFNMLKNSKCPLVLVGGGCQYTKKQLRDFLKLNNLPVVVSMRGLDIVPHDMDNYIGFIGSYGNRIANLAIKYTDLLIVLGSRLDERQMGYKKNEFAPNAKIIQVDIDKIELGRKMNCDLLINSDVESFLSNVIKSEFQFDFSTWTKFLKSLSNESVLYNNNKHSVSNFLIYLSNIIDNDCIISVDVGQNQVISSQCLNLKCNNKFLSSSGLACMGYSLPASIGAYYADNKCQNLSINGDGGFQMNIQELETISREKLPIKIIILHNNCLGLIRKLQDKLFNKRYYASVEGFSCPDFEKIANAYNINYYKIKKNDDYKKLCNILKKDIPYIIDVILPVEIDANPEPGNTIFEQEPPINSNIILKLENFIKEL